MTITGLKKIILPPSPFRVTSETAPANPALEGQTDCAICLVTIKGLGEKSNFLQICNLYTFQFHISSCSSMFQFIRILIPFWTPVNVNSTHN